MLTFAPRLVLAFELFVLAAEFNSASNGVTFKRGHRAKRGSLVSDTRFLSCDGKLKRN